jgi:hypothetical protein
MYGNGHPHARDTLQRSVTSLPPLKQKVNDLSTPHIVTGLGSRQYGLSAAGGRGTRHRTGDLTIADPPKSHCQSVRPLGASWSRIGRGYPLLALSSRCFPYSALIFKRDWCVGSRRPAL